MQDATSMNPPSEERRHLRTVFSTLFSIIVLIAFSLFVSSNSATHAASSTPTQTTITLDGVTLSVDSKAVPAPFVVSQPDNAVQMASAVAQRPYREFQIESIPFSTTSSVERFPVAASGKEGSFRSILHSYRLSQGGTGLASPPTITIFGKQVQGETNLVRLHLTDASTLQTAVMSEYVVEAGSRLWLIRISQEQVSDTQISTLASQSATFANTISATKISSTNLGHPSTLVASLAQEKARTSAVSPNAVNPNAIGTPSWWSGTCNYNNFLRDTGWEAWKMNSGYNGVYPCGPRPSAGGPDHLVQFYSGSWGAYEFECVELALRWMYQAYGVKPYKANGNQIVNNYSTSYGGGLRVIHNNTACCGYPKPGDILSYCSTCTNGHTSVTMSSSVNSSGNGSVTVMEENASYGGMQTLTVTNYEVQNSPEGWIYGYLRHD
ncbi:CHAP domain-containing protein [Ktedonospora formicarum]|uniref:Peptidase C51 domain-containing protein n=1 Tax=Ktedonospora formicarum TaxID=2778364 RepID=A0A8J3I2E7_9CHLR|nr:CHAP domain-containing protein [Ktedonospora formicarum]GHO48074.1 hypothetical protein KSX_62370 [Ktedonospora formicarum]